MNRPGFAGFKRVPVSDGWFEVHEIATDLFTLCEPRHYESTIVSLVIGQEKAALIDTGCGIGNLGQVVAELTDLPVMVINTHTHTDHLGGNNQFAEIAMYDHPLARRVAEQGVSHETMQVELLAEDLVTPPWPPGFDRTGVSVRPFQVSRWLKDGERIDLGGRELEVLHTPGESPDHIALLDRSERLLFCGDILLHGPVWTHLEGGSVAALIGSYRRLMGHLDEFDYLMPGHNEPMIAQNLLPEALAGAGRVASGQAAYEMVTDPWNQRLRRYGFERFAILTPADGPR